MEQQQRVTHKQPNIHSPEKKKNGSVFILIGAVVLLAIAGIIYLMVISSPETSERVKNISIILFIFTSVLGTISFVILVVQFATLVNLLKNEIKPVLNTTKETVDNVKGTVSFIGDKMVSPVIETNAKIAGFNRIISILIPRNKKKDRS